MLIAVRRCLRHANVMGRKPTERTAPDLFTTETASALPAAEEAIEICPACPPASNEARAFIALKTQFLCGNNMLEPIATYGYPKSLPATGVNLISARYERYRLKINRQ
jgi:uncharacterized protein YcgI (DUF1989 family)